MAGFDHTMLKCDRWSMDYRSLSLANPGHLPGVAWKPLRAVQGLLHVGHVALKHCERNVVCVKHLKSSSEAPGGQSRH